MDIGEWLRGLGLIQYETTFRENEIDIDILPELTEPDLEKLGVPLGHRKRLLKAIAGLSAERPEPAPLSASQPAAPIKQETAGERRHVTVMFCDLVDSTGIAARLDVEEWRDLVGAYLDAASTAVTEMGGKVAKKLGDGLMALFGHSGGAGERCRACGAGGARNTAGASRIES